MTAPGNDLLYLTLTLIVFVSSGYAIGRIHQWHRHGLERDEAYRTGYDKASHSIIGMTTEQNSTRPVPGTTATRLAASSPARRDADRTRGHRVPVEQRGLYSNQRKLYPVRSGPAGPSDV